MDPPQASSLEGVTGIGLYPDGMVEHDKMVGDMLKKLDDLGIADNTIVIYGTDNGAETVTWPDGGTTPFHGEKGTTWEGGFRVPSMVRWPGVIKPGTIINDIMSQEDWMPTLLAAAGEPDIVEKLQAGPPGQRQDLQGSSRRLQLPAVTSRARPRRARGRKSIYFGQGGELNAVRWNDWKVHFASVAGNIATGTRAVTGWPMIVNLRADPYEKAPNESGAVHPLVRRQHVALRAGAAEAQGVPHDHAGLSLPAGQQPERRRHQLSIAQSCGCVETAKGTGDYLSTHRSVVGGDELRASSRALPMRSWSSSCA